MRNLKKILALALALVMTLSVMSFASASTYPDSGSITAKYTEAVDVLSSLKVFVGKDTGNFDPQANIKRSEVAAIIYRIVTGDVENTNVGLYSDYNVFSDVSASSWYAGYVNYCANAEYIKGMGNGTFKPDANVTGYQVLAMILRAVGYDQNGEFTGSGWQVRVASTARELGITDTVSEVTLGQAVTREVVAELLFRTITLAPMVTYTPALGYSQYKNNGITGASAKDLNPTVGYNTFGLEKTDGVITAVNRTAGTTTLVDDSTAANGATLTPVTVTGASSDWTDIGYEAYVYTVATTGVKTRAAVSDLHITGVSLAVNTAETSDKTIAPLVNAGAAKIATLDSREGYTVYYNGVEIVKAEDADTAYALGATDADAVWFNTATKALVKGNVRSGSVGNYNYTGNQIDMVNGLKVDFIDNDNGGEAEVIVFTEYTAATVTGIATTTNTGANAIVRDTYYFENDSEVTSSVKSANLVSSSELAVGDLVTYVAYAGDTYVTVAPYTTGVFTQINYSKTYKTTESYVIGGTTYVPAHDEDTQNGYLQDYLQDATPIETVLTTGNVGKTMVVYTDPYGYILQVSESVASSNYLYVVRTNHSDNVAGTTYATVALADGTVQNVYLTRSDANKFEDITTDAYTYTVNAAGNYVLGNDCDDSTSDYLIHETNAAYDNTSKKNVNLVSGGVLTNATVVIDLRDVISKRTTTPEIYTGYANVPSLEDYEVHYVVNNSGFVTLAFLTKGTNTADNTKSFVVYTTNAHYYGTTADGEKLYTLPVITDGAISTITLTETQYTDVSALGVGVYTYGANGTTLTYKSFDGNMQDIKWQNEAIIVGSTGYAYSDSSVKFFTLDIANGNAYDYVMTAGLDKTKAKAYVVTKGNEATEIYVVYGDVADTAANEVTPNNGDDNGVLAQYAVSGTDRVKGTTNTYGTNGVGGTGYNWYMKAGYITHAVALPTTSGVTFYGVEDDDTTNDQDITATTSHANTIKVTYDQALENGNGVVVTGGTASIVDNDTNKVVSNATPDATKVKTYTVVVTWDNGTTETWTMIQDKGSNDAKLLVKGTSTEVDKIDGISFETTNANSQLKPNGANQTIADFLGKLDVSKGASAEVDIVLGNGTESKGTIEQVSNAIGSNKTDEIKDITITVISQDGTASSGYWNQNAADTAVANAPAIQLAQLKSNAKTALANYTTANGVKLDNYKDNEDVKNVVDALTAAIDGATTQADLEKVFKSGAIMSDQLESLLDFAGGESYDIVAYTDTSSSKPYNRLFVAFQKYDGTFLSEAEVKNLLGYSSIADETTVAQKFILTVGSGEKLGSCLGTDGDTGKDDFGTEQNLGGAGANSGGIVKVIFNDTSSNGTNGLTEQSTALDRASDTGNASLKIDGVNIHNTISITISKDT